MGPEDGCGTESEASMIAVSASKAWKILIALVACLIAVATTVCLVHTDGIARHPQPTRGIAIPPRPPRRTSPSICIVFSPSCRRRSCWSGSVLVPSFSVLWSHPLVPLFPPFIPPKTLARA